MICPKCGAKGTLEVRRKLIGKPIGSFSLSGMNMKISAFEGAEAFCTEKGCGFAVIGHLESGPDPEVDKVYFVADEKPQGGHDSA